MGGFVGLDVDYSSQNVISGNKASNSGMGIVMYGSEYNNITGNIASNTGSWGLYLGASHFNKIFNNTASYGQNHGLYISNSNNNIIFENIFTGNRYYGIILNDANSNEVYGNDLTNNEHACILNSGYGNIIFDVNEECIEYALPYRPQVNPNIIIMIILLITVPSCSLIWIFFKRRKLKKEPAKPKRKLEENRIGRNLIAGLIIGGFIGLAAGLLWLFTVTDWFSDGPISLMFQGVSAVQFWLVSIGFGFLLGSIIGFIIVLIIIAIKWLLSRLQQYSLKN